MSLLVSARDLQRANERVDDLVHVAVGTEAACRARQTKPSPKPQLRLDDRREPVPRGASTGVHLHLVEASHVALDARDGATHGVFASARDDALGADARVDRADVRLEHVETLDAAVLS
ncbi:MAG: hypothetical protein KC657_14235 [Myxococcales bacterium]|nr:hypothetical protein [Myxococcales bacterium]